MTLLEPRGPNNPGSAELAAPTVEARGTPSTVVPPAVRDLIAQLATAIASLDENARTSAPNCAVTELTRQLPD